MHRSLRGMANASAALLTACTFVCTDLALAPVQAAAPQPPGNITSKDGISGRLADKVRLGDGLHIYYASLHQLGVGYPAGVTDNTPIDSVNFTVNPLALHNYLVHLALRIRSRHVDAYPEIVPGIDTDHEEVPARIMPGHPGITLEVDAAEHIIQSALERDPGTRHIVLPVKLTPEKITASDLAGINGRIAYYSTYFDPYDVGRTQTVRLATEKVNGALLQPGQVFSLNGTIGPRDPAHGFTGKSNVFIDGKMAMQYGGGMCQVATTVFNAAMKADLKIVERHAHIRTIPYAPPGSDATVYYGKKDLKFANDTGAPIYVADRTTLFHDIVDIYGKMVPGRKVVIKRHFKQLAQRHVTATMERIVYEPDGAVVKGPLFRSDYKWTAALSFHTHSL